MVDSIGSQYQNYTPTQLKGQQLGQSDFLRLMTAQLSSQDPFNPVDNQEMVAQMAQFSSLAGVSETNTVLKSISEQLAAQTALIAALGAKPVGDWLACARQLVLRRAAGTARAVMAAGAVMQGSRNGVDLPERDIDRVKSHLAKYYRKMDDTPPWDRD